MKVLSKNHQTVHFKWVNYIVCELHLDKAVVKIVCNKKSTNSRNKACTLGILSKKIVCNKIAKTDILDLQQVASFLRWND